MQQGNAGHLGQSGATALHLFSAGDHLTACLVSAVAASGLEPGCLTYLSLRWCRRRRGHGVAGLRSRRLRWGQTRHIPLHGAEDSRQDPLGLLRQSSEAPSLQPHRDAANAINKVPTYVKCPYRLDEQMFWGQRKRLLGGMFSRHQTPVKADAKRHTDG